MALWVGYGYLRFRDAISKANDRLDPKTRAALTPDGGSILSTSTNVLVLGSDRRPGETSSRSDSILLIRSDPGKNQIAELSIPRDLRVPIPGHGDDKINAAYAYGGPTLAIQTINDLLGQKDAPVNHVVLVDFGGFKDLIDSLGGITIVNPEKIISNSFDGVVWRFSKGSIHLDGRHALAYARVRENTRTPGTRTSPAACASSGCCPRSPAAWPRSTRCSTCRASATPSESRSPPISRPTA